MGTAGFPGGGGGAVLKFVLTTLLGVAVGSAPTPTITTGVAVGVGAGRYGARRGNFGESNCA